MNKLSLKRSFALALLNTAMVLLGSAPSFGATVLTEPFMPLPDEEIIQIWQRHLIKSGRTSVSALNEMPYPSVDALERDLRSLGVAEEAIKEILQSAIYETPPTILFRLPKAWSLLSEAAKRHMLLGVVNQDTATRTGVRVEVAIAPEESLDDVARKYAGADDPSPLLEYLRTLRERAGAHETIRVPLETMLSPFIKDRTGKYAKMLYAQCHTASINALRGAQFDEQFIDGSQLFGLLDAMSLRYVDSGEEIRPMDILIYINNEFSPVHSAIAVGDGLVFTKNGATPLSPYIFQSQADVERIYEDIVRKKGQRMNLLVLRPISPNDLSRPGVTRFSRQTGSRDHLYDRHFAKRCEGVFGGAMKPLQF